MPNAPGAVEPRRGGTDPERIAQPDLVVTRGAVCAERVLGMLMERDRVRRRSHLPEYIVTTGPIWWGRAARTGGRRHPAAGCLP